MVPDEFPQDAAHFHLLFWGKLLACDDHALGFLHLVLLKSELNKLVAQVDEGDARGVVAAVHYHVDSVSKLLVVVEEMNGICIVIHSGFVLNDGANIGFFLKRTNWQPKKPNFFHTYINICSTFFVPLHPQFE